MGKVIAMRGSYENHPGHETNCPYQMKVNPHPTSTSSRGYACRYTGGHCLLDRHCEKRAQEWEEQEKIMIQSILYKPSFKTEYWAQYSKGVSKRISKAAWFKLYDLPGTKVLGPLTKETK